MFRPTLFAVALLASAPVLAQAPAPSPAPAQAPVPVVSQAGSQTSIPRAKSTTAPRAVILANAEVEFGKVDANKDGQMSRTEIETFQRDLVMANAMARNKAVFAALDSDKNGQLSAAEFAKLNSDTPKVDATNVLRIDTNKDGQISLAEHRAATLETFAKVDTNKDGILTAAEAEAAIAKK